MLFIIFESSFGSIPSKPLITPVIYFVGMNSINAIDFNYPITARALSGMFIVHIGMKTRNYKRLTKFHKYFSPKLSKTLTNKFTVAIVFIPEETVAVNC